MKKKDATKPNNTKENVPEDEVMKLTDKDCKAFVSQASRSQKTT